MRRPSKQPPLPKQAVEPPYDGDVAVAQRCARQEKVDIVRRDLEHVTESLPLKTQRAVEFIKEKGASSWLSVIPLTRGDLGKRLRCLHRVS